MKLVEDYLHNAEICEGLAKKARSEQEKKMILEMAATWRMLAAQRNKKLKAQA